ncbi:PAS domain-containing sensor histidine kinase [Haloferax sp. Atlit-6N]|uniref:histidine kinase n=1 Tax=Haloferax gibbonsii (strain ATCC 33959 / DSM 4427 / JCM 8863 / NBRC 102184 / NCIMB 2188 / Ma 2.38) TaxID=1227459 RepID=M0HHN6_HALGM|nr:MULTISPECIES: PAS domain-containing sensor histidine kinase [Haloferax]ELZ84030.1 HTR-like protein [Haloferax gibbonsii ATCC 33959]RDZ54127.1 PAS domain-containing sensor histidine kinase [Haloferax sp. Atlit-4N]REA06217.1 PAS domain-containing sensor histidine kinase [Haloferax sp. Atlit-6N]
MSNVTSSSLAFSSLDALPTQLAILDEDGVILYTNRAWREFGTEHDYQGDSSSVGTNYLGVCDLSTTDDATTASQGIRAVIDGERDEFSFEYPCETPDERLWFTMRATRFVDDGDTYVQIAHLDITDRKRAELEAEEKAERLQNLARMLSHDLRNPLSVAAGYVESLLDEAVAADRLEPVAGALDRMDDIITDALVLARHDAVEELSTVDLETRASAAWEHVETGSAELVVADSFEFRADPNLLGHVFENLFRNGVEHGGTDHLTVTVGVLDGDSDGDATGFYVEDDGVGIPAETRDEVFEAGYSTGEEGTGLGLSIVAQAAHAHGWDIGVTEADRGGARFEITGVERPA